MLLEDILESQPESSVLAFLILAPPRSFSILELSERLGIPQSKLATILALMARAGRLKVVSRQGKRYYLLNQKYKIFPEIRQALLKDRKPYEDELFSAIKKVGDIKAAFLSGLFSGYPELPVDILIVGKVNETRLEQFIQNCQKMMEQEINYSTMPADEFYTRRNSFDRFLKDIFDYPHLVVIDTLTR